MISGNLRESLVIYGFLRDFTGIYGNLRDFTGLTTFGATPLLTSPQGVGSRSIMSIENEK